MLQVLAEIEISSQVKSQPAFSFFKFSWEGRIIYWRFRSFRHSYNSRPFDHKIEIEIECASAMVDVFKCLTTGNFVKLPLSIHIVRFLIFCELKI